MPRVLMCSGGALEGELADSFFLRADVDRTLVSSATSALDACRKDRFDLIAVDADLTDAAHMLRSLRREPGTRHVSVVVLSREDFSPGELELLEAGANGILRLPPSRDWDERLTRLCRVPVRREARFQVAFEIATLTGLGATLQAQARNISVTGLLLDSSQELAVGTDLDIHFRLSVAGPEIRARGRVVRRAPRSSSYGIEFEQLEGDAISRIQAYVDAQAVASQAP